MTLKSKAQTIRHGAGFTLVELLVVLAIIAVLISLMAPAIQRARNAAISVHCSSNQRHMGIPYLVFADDHRGRLFPIRLYLGDDRDANLPEAPSLDSQWAGSGRFWIQRLHSVGYLEGPLSGAQKNPILYCPVRWPPGTPQWTSSYGLRSWNGEAVHSAHSNPIGSGMDALPISMIAHPDSFFLITDSIDPRFMRQTYRVMDGPSLAIHQRHGSGANAFFLDGSVQSLEEPFLRALRDKDGDYTPRYITVVRKDGTVFEAGLPWRGGVWDVVSP